MKNIIALSLFVSLSGCAKWQDRSPSDAGSAENAQPSIEIVNGHVVMAGEVIYAGDIDQAQSILSKKGLDHSVEKVDEGLYLIRSLAPTAEILSNLGGVGEFAEPNYQVKKSDISEDVRSWPKDPSFLSLWGLNNIGQDAPNGVEGVAKADMQMLKAWEINKGSKEVIVGVIDTGVDYTHPDLKANIWVNEAEKNGNDGVDDDGNGFVDDVYGWDFSSDQMSGGKIGKPDPMDDNNHGTHCAGTIGASGNNVEGVVGVTWNVRIMPIKFLTAAGSGSMVGAYRSIMYGVKNGAHVLSNSWGGGGESKLLKRAIEEAHKAGILFVAAAGNENKNTDLNKNYPSGYEVPNVVSVGASDNRDQRAVFSNYGMNSVHVFAPGVAIMSTTPPAINEGVKYQAFSGTSMATPHVAGLAALILSAHAELRGQPEKLKELLIQTSDLVPSLAAYSQSGGRVNAYKALSKQVAAPAVARNYREQPYNFTSVSLPRDMVDQWHKIQIEGASGLRVHFNSIFIDQGFDSVWIYDKNKKLMGDMTTYMNGEADVDVWSPTVSGDTIYVRFVNAKVGSFDLETGEVSQEFPNFASEGFTIDKVGIYETP